MELKMDRLKDKHCIVTGAASGIGRETAIVFHSNGAKVTALDKDSGGLVYLEKNYDGIIPVSFDTANACEVEGFFSHQKSVDVLFNCAGVVKVGSIENCSEDDWEQSIHNNMTSIFRMSRAVLSIMAKQKSGSLINMASVISSIGGAPNRFAYGTTKAAVLGMTKSIAKDYARLGVRCNAICPSAVETRSMKARIDAMDNPEKQYKLFSKRQPIGRMAKTIEIANLALYLASDESSFMTGSVITIDGGAKL